MTEKIQKYTFLATILLVPLIFNVWGFDIYEIPKNILFKIGMATALLIFLLKDFWSKEKKLHISKRQIWLTAGLVAILGLSLVTGIRPQISFFGSYYRQGGTINMLFYIVAFVLTLQILHEKKDKILFLRGLSVVGSIMSVYAIIQKLGLDIFSTETTAIFEGRSFSTMGNPTSLGAFLLFPIWGEITLFSLEKKKKNKIKNILALAIMLLALIFTRNRGSMLALMGAGFLHVLNKFKHKKKLLAGLLISLAAIFSVFIYTYGGDTRSLGSRLTIWDSSFEIIKESPVLGYGLESFAYLFESYVQPEFFEYEDYYNLVDRPHNEFLEMWIHLGLAGLIFYLIVLYAVLKKTFTTKDKIEYFGSLAVISLFMTNFFGFSLVTQYAYLAVFLGLIFKGAKQIKIIRPASAILALLLVVSIGFHIRLFIGDRAFKEAYNDLYAVDTYEVMTDLETGVNLLPFYAETYFEAYYFYYGFAEYTLDQTLIDQAYYLNEQAGAIAHSSTKYYLHSAKLYILQSDYLSAENVYITALQRISANPILYEDMGNMYYEAEDYAKASIMYDKLLSVLPEDWAAPVLSAEESEFTQEEHIFWKTHPGFLDTLNNIVVTYYATGQNDKADTIMEQIK